VIVREEQAALCSANSKCAAVHFSIDLPAILGALTGDQRTDVALSPGAG
jgi:hypothetical protein